MTLDLMSIELSQDLFTKISKLVYRIAGINLPATKMGLVKSRLLKRLRELDLFDFESYWQYVENDKTGLELAHMIDIITTNKTDFFREPQHFNFIKEHVIPGLNKKEKIRLWSAGCSSGAEPLTMALILYDAIDNIKNYDIQILATDISNEILKIARLGEYDHSLMEGVPRDFINKYFISFKSADKTIYKVKDNIRSLVKFANHNLMSEWPMKGPFDIIFCRNVMIYFDKDIRQYLVKRFHNILKPSGYFFVGHSESLSTTHHNFKYVQPAVYQKITDYDSGRNSETGSRNW